MADATLAQENPQHRTKLAEKHLATQYAVTRALIDSDALADAIPRVLQAIAQGMEWRWGALWSVDRETTALRCQNIWHAPSLVTAEFDAVSRATPFRLGEPLPGLVWQTGKAAWITDVADDATFLRAPSALRLGLHGAIAFPVRFSREMFGVIEFFSGVVRQPRDEELETLSAIGTQIGQVMERKRAEQALRDSEERYRILVESSPFGIGVHHDGICLYMNPAGARLMGESDPAKFVGKSIFDSIHPDSRAVVIKRLRGLKAGDAAPLIEERFVTLDGEVRDVEVAATPIRYQGRPAVQAIVHDITDRKRAQAEIEKSLSLLRATLESTADGIVVVDLADHIVVSNRKFIDLWRLPDEFLESGEDGRVRAAVAGMVCDPDAFERRLQEIREQPDAETFDVLELRDGRVLERCSQPQRISGKHAGRVWSFRDVTERRRAERALEDLAGRLIHAQEEERKRVGRELHDHVSQQLALLSIKLDMLRGSSATPLAMATALEQLRQYTAEIADDVYRLCHRLHSSMLDQLGLLPALQKLVEEFSERHDLAIDFAHTSIERQVPPEIALCLFRVVEEALGNVAKHSGASSARVSFVAAANGLRISVDDRGAGFDVASVSSAGIGLVSMRERLRLVHGEIRIEAAPCQGTRIEAWVPWTSRDDG